MRNRIVSTFLFVTIISCLSAQNQKDIDSLDVLYSQANHDTVKVQLLNKIANFYWFVKPDTAIQISRRALDISIKNDYKSGAAASYNSIGACNIIISNFPVALDNFLRALEVGKSLGNSNITALQYQNIGVVYLNMENYDEALNNLNKGLEIAERLGDNHRILYILNNMAGVYNYLNKHDLSLKYSLKAYSYLKGSNKYFELSAVSINISTNYQQLGNDTLTLKFAKEALSYAEKVDDLGTVSTVYFNFGWYYTRNGDTKKGIYYYEKAYEMTKETKDYNKISIVAKNLYVNYKTLKKLDKALEYHEIEESFRDSVFNESKNKEINGLQLKYEREQNEKDKTISNQKSEKQKIVLISISTIVLLLVFIVTFILRRLQITKRQKRIIEKQNVDLIDKNVEISEQAEEITTQKDNLQILNDELSKLNDEITAQNQIINHQHQNIVASITYATRLQNALIPPISLLTEFLPESFVLFKPRDIVSGDFYWFKSINDRIYIVAADCTGHGVSGALMSMLGISQLNELVVSGEDLAPHKVLNKLRERIKKSLHQTGDRSEAKDGMDIAFCMIDLETKTMQYAGASNPLYLIRNNELIEYKADKMPIGVHPKDNQDFTSTTIKLLTNDSFYIFSDGYTSQFGGEKEDKFKSQRFKDLLISLNGKPMNEQHTALNQTINRWRGDLAQTDDILVIGVCVP